MVLNGIIKLRNLKIYKILQIKKPFTGYPNKNSNVLRSGTAPSITLP